MEKEQRRLGFRAAPIIGLFLLPLFYAGFFVENIIDPDQWMRFFNCGTTFSRKDIAEEETLRYLLERLVRGKDRIKLEKSGFACDIAENSIVCVVSQPVRTETSKMTVYVPDHQIVQEETVVRPYARQQDKYLLRSISPVRIVHGISTPPNCQYYHGVPLVIFSSGLQGNLFHEFNDIIIPLFITTKHFQSRVLFMLEDYNPLFVKKFNKILSRLSAYVVINPAQNGGVHCFPGAIVGLKYHGNLALNSSDIPGGYSMSDFRQFLKETYSLKFTRTSQIRNPILTLISRDKTRKFLNEDKLLEMIKDLGFRVIVAKPEIMSDLDEFANVVNSCNVLVGVHGAGLANELFLPDGAVMVQVELLGLEWASATYFGEPAHAMGVHYLRYKIEPQESSLVELYGYNHSVITDPMSIFAKGYQAARAVYVDQQNVRVNLVRFRKALTEALSIVRNSSSTL